MKRLVVFFVLFSTPALAEDIVIDRALWLNMGAAFAALSMPLQSHQSVQQIMGNVEQAANQRAAAKAKAEAEKEKPDGK